MPSHGSEKEGTMRALTLVMIDYGMLGQYDPTGASNFPSYFDYWTEKTGNQNIVPTKNAFVIEQPLATDEDRILIWLSMSKLTDEQKKQYKCFVMNIDDLFDADGKIYSIDGRFVGKDMNNLAKGIYIMNGKKFAVK